MPAALAVTVSMTAAAGTGAADTATPSGGPGHWSMVTTGYPDVGVVPFQDIGLARGSNGVLQVIWASPGPASTHEILDTPISAAGHVGHAVVVASGMRLQLSTNEEAPFGPAATVTKHGIDAFWNSLNDGVAETQEYTHPLGNGPWSFGQLIRPLAGFDGFDSSMAAATGSDGKPWTAYFAALTASWAVTVLHSGHAQRNVVANAECCSAGPAIGIDAHSHVTWLAYQSLASRPGIFAQRLAQNGTATGSSVLLPGSATKTSVLPVNERVAITGRGHGRPGVYVAYAAFSGANVARVDLIRLGASKPSVLSTAPGARQVTGVALSANPAGALWVTWLAGDGLYVRLSNGLVSKFSRTLRVKLPSGTTGVREVYTSAQRSRLDVLVLLDRDGTTAYWATQVANLRT